ncbi:major facilitator superfamily domain-containing protein 6-like [Acanthaster planci]|uniref:Major facilitator superfamily domain-containing protein 6-like n=1 Tax=Acanthaster planci TaxID=133434 RepID=A0A8B7XTL9_ACAPL|nr:major facilitator superfamily domain-containing protein 6-like [Acanthaster planci]XP_022083271.1 major facilitator superfamily domain-containing protein 6-like [Acanthaster planci]XP_022083276.1 major facilitator superfamily domain-containing protein 6-like [Acanthaster planci]
MYYPDDDTLVIERKDVIRTTTNEDDSDTSSQTSSSRRYKGYCSGRLNPDLLLCKIFYFTFYGSYGSLYPLIAVYFKQLGLSPSQSGVLVGIRPFVEFCAAPMWGAVADTWRKAKAILLFSLLSWLVFTEAVAFVQPAPSTCVVINSTVHRNATLVVIGDSKSTGKEGSISNVEITKINVDHGGKAAVPGDGNEEQVRRDANDTASKIIVVPKPNTEVTISNTTTVNKASKEQRSVTVIKYTAEDRRLTFICLLLLMILGEFFSSPTITLADSATLGYLGHQRMEMYGRQRMFGSLAWGIFMFVEGFILDRTKTTKVECDGQVTMEEVNYLICFGTYAVMITCAFFVATQFQYKYRSLHEVITVGQSKYTTDKLQHVHGKGASEVIELENVKKTVGKFQRSSDEMSSGGDHNQDEDEPRYWEVLSLYASVRYGTVLYVVWFAGFGFGFLFTFLYWHLKDLGGPPTLFGVASIINHLSEVTGYFFSGWFIRKLGHIPVLCLGLSCFAVRFITVSYLVNPWGVLAVETLQGVTHALVWAASTSFIGSATSQKNRSSAQGILQGVYHGLGRGCGAIFGGVIISAYGSTVTFRSIGVTYVVVILIFAFIQYMESDTDDKKEDEDLNYVNDEEDDPEDIEDTPLLSQDEGTKAEKSDVTTAIDDDQNVNDDDGGEVRGDDIIENDQTPSPKE